MKKPPLIRTGCCGFALAQAKYFASFGCVEIATSFYNLPKLATAAQWRAAAPVGFEFALKAWQVITHPPESPTYKRTRLDPRDRPHCGGFGYNPTIRWAWDQTFQVARELGAVLVLFQCPASFRPTKEHVARVRQFFERAKRGRFELGWQVQGDWPAELVAQLCRELDLVPVVDPLRAEARGDSALRYYRVRGPLGEQPRLSEQELQRLREVCVADKRPVYCLFNHRAMAADAARFQQRLLRPPSP